MNPAPKPSGAKPATSANRPTAVLVGLDSMQGLGAARLLAKRGVPVVGIAADPHNDACKTRVCQEIIAAETDTDGLIEVLEALAARLAHKAVLYPCEDSSVLLVSRHREHLEPWYHIILPPAHVVEMLMDKTSFYTFAQENDFPIPRTHLIGSREELDAVIDDVAFPCIMKPANSATSRWESSVTVSAFRVADRDELLELYDAHRELTDMMIVQQWIDGSDADLFSCNCYFNSDSQPLATFVARKIRQWPPHIGKSCLGEECRDETVLHETIRLFSSVGYRGLGYVEFKRDSRSGEYFIIEPNVGRPTGRSAIAEAGGVELLYTMYCDVVGLPLPAARQQTYGAVKWIHLRHDFQSALYYWRKGELTLTAWWSSWRGKKAFALFSWTDPKPFLSDLWRVARVIISPSRRRKWMVSPDK